DVGRYRLSAGSSEWISAEELKQELATIPGRVVLAVNATRREQKSDRQREQSFCADSSMEDGANQLDMAGSEVYRGLLGEECGVVVLRSTMTSSAAQASSGTGVFGQALAEAVGGRADENRDGQVQLHELAHYLGSRVRELSGGKQKVNLQRPPAVPNFPI